MDNQKPFESRLRSSVRVKQAEKRHLADPSLAAALLGATPDRVLQDLNTLGFLFEALCERDLRIYAESFDAEAEGLLKIQSEIISEKDGKPAKILCVLCGLTNAAYRRTDGVYVVPITAFKP